MLYQPPYVEGATPAVAGIHNADADAAYSNGNALAGLEGSYVPAEAVEHTQRELLALITAAGLTPDVADLAQAAKAVQTGKVISAADSGTANALVVTLVPVPATRPNLLVVLKGAAGVTGATTIDVNGIGAVAVKWPNGTDLTNGDWPASAIGILAWDGAKYQLVSVMASSQSTSSRVIYAVDTGATGSALVITPAPAISAYAAGIIYFVKLAHDIAASPTMNVNGKGARTIVANGGRDIQAGDFKAGDVILLVDDGTNLQLMSSTKYLRKAPTGTLTLWVRSDGNDANDGSANDAAHAFLTIAGAVTYANSNYNASGAAFTLRFGLAGSYAGYAFVGVAGAFTILGDTANPQNYILTSALSSVASNVTVTGCTSTATGYQMSASSGGTLNINTCRYAGAGATYCIAAELNGSVMLTGVITFACNASAALYANGGAIGGVAGATTLAWTTNVTYSWAAAVSYHSGGVLILQSVSVSVSGGVTVTGNRYEANINGDIYVAGAGVNFLPGTVAGTTANGGQYI